MRGLVAAMCLAASASGADLGKLRQVSLARLRIESGSVTSAGGVLTLHAPTIRAVVPGSGSAARLDFTYLGPTKETAPLASGELRRQIGLKLRARDTCNVIYVMWHIAPSSGIVVEAKLNPSARSHLECKDRGYLRVRPARDEAVAPVREGERRSLAAVLEGRTLRVFTDGSLTWEGIMPRDAEHLDGPVGIRSDNGAFDAELWSD